MTVNTSMYIDFIDHENVTSVFREICKKYNATVINVITPMIDNWQSNKSVQRTNFWLIICITIVLIFLIIIASWITCIHIKLKKLTVEPYTSNFNARYSELKRNSV